MRPLRVAIVGAYDPDYARNAIIRIGLERCGVEVVAAPSSPNASTRQRVMSAIRAFPGLSDCDIVIVPPFNQLLAPFVWVLGLLFRQPVLLDYMIGLTDSRLDRGRPNDFRAWLFRQVDRFNLTRLTTMTDTEAHRQVFACLLGGDIRKMHVLPVGARDNLIQAAPPLPPADSAFVVQYVGTYIPFHGMDIILQAAALLKAIPRIEFELIGRGQTYDATLALARDLGLDNVIFTPGFFHPPQLIDMLARGSVLLGVFGPSEKTGYVVPNKVYEGLALGRAVITAESSALDEFFTSGEHLITVPAADPPALVAAIRYLADSPEELERIAAAGTRRIREAFTPEHIGRQLKATLDTLTMRPG